MYAYKDFSIVRSERIFCFISITRFALFSKERKKGTYVCADIRDYFRNQVTGKGDTLNLISREDGLMYSARVSKYRGREISVHKRCINKREEEREEGRWQRYCLVLCRREKEREFLLRLGEKRVSTTLSKQTISRSGKPKYLRKYSWILLFVDIIKSEKGIVTLFSANTCISVLLGRICFAQ